MASRTEHLLFRVSFGFWGGFPNKVSPPQSFVRELKYFPEQNVHSKAVGSDLEVVSRTECPFKGSWFGFWGDFPNRMSLLGRFVREKGKISERSVSVAGKRSFFYLCAPAGCPIAQEIGRKVRAGKGSALWKAQIGEEFMQG